MKSVFPSIRLTSVMVLVAAMAFTSCKKNDDAAPNDEMNTAVDVTQSNEVAGQQFDDVFNIVLGVQSADAGEDIGIGSGGGIMYKPGGGETTLGDRCYTITVIPKERNVWPKTVTIDFGNGCKGEDGKVRKGKIVSIFTKAAFLPGAKISTTFVGYEVDSFALAGTHIVTNISNDNRLAFKTEVINGKLTNTSSGFWHKYDREHKFVQFKGMDTPLNPFDDAYEITGTSKGSNSNGRTWVREITTPVVKKTDCKWRVKGVVTIHWNQNAEGATLDYGDGNCDDQATLSYKGHTKMITLK